LKALGWFSDLKLKLWQVTLHRGILGEYFAIHRQKSIQKKGTQLNWE